jgi:hypothetical protein
LDPIHLQRQVIDRLFPCNYNRVDVRPRFVTHRPPLRRLGRWALLFGVVGAIALAAYLPSILRSAAVLSTSAGMYDAGAFARLVSEDVRVTEATLELDAGRTLRDRVYTPAATFRPPVAFVLHGVHPRGIDEPRLRSFATALAAVGLEIHTPELPELAAFRPEPRLIADITAIGAALQRASDGRKVGAFGISFAGGLLLVAAASDAGHATFEYVVALGAHHDMRRLARYYAGAGIAVPEGAHPPPEPHPYAGRILASAYAEQLFGAEAEAAREALALHLAERYRDASRAREQLSPAAQARFAEVLAGPGPELRPLLLAAADRHAAAFASLSPAGRLGRLRAPVFLLHGQDDPIVPSSETGWLRHEVPEHALRRVLVTPALRHAEGSATPSAFDTVEIVAFLADVLRKAGR